MQQYISRLYEKPFPQSAIEAVRQNSWVLGRDYNINRLVNVINPLLRGYTQMQSSFAKCMKDFSDMMRVLLSIKKMADDGRLKHENLLSKVELFSQVMFYDETIFTVQTKLREVGAVFRDLMPPLEVVVYRQTAQRETGQQRRGRRADRE